MDPYRDSIEHLREELVGLDLLLRRAIIIARMPRAAAVPEEFRGLVISEPEIDALLEGVDFIGERWRREQAVRDTLRPIDQRLTQLREQIDQRRELTQQAGRRLTLPSLAQRFGLSRAEVDLLLMALAPELEAHYETLYAYLQNDVTRKRPSVDLALNLVCRSEREKIYARRLLAPGSPLLHFRLIELLDESQDRQPALLRKFLKMDESVMRFLLEQPPTGLTSGVLIMPHTTIDTLETNAATRTRLQNIADALQRSGMEHAAIRLIGSTAAELDASASALCATLHRRMLTFELAELDTDPALAAALVRALVRDAALWDAILTVRADEATESAPEEQRVARAEMQLWRGLKDTSAPVMLLGPSSAFHAIPPEVWIWRLAVEPPDFALRRRTWEETLAGVVPSVDHDRLADLFQFGGDRIRQAGTLAWTLAALRNPSDPAPSITDVLEAGRSLTTSHLRRFATAVEPRYTWSDLVLPDEKMGQLRSIVMRIRYRGRVHRDWGFGAKLSRGKGLNVLFTGPSGTGKTMAAEILAGELALDLFQIDLSSVVSKYIGETEKNLSMIFREAELSQTLLFFDEADALFGKRTEVKDAHDRYANIEVNYLLQRIEQYQGVVVLATNMQRNLDDAFLRRIQEVVEFPFPDESLRERIWRGHFPPDAPQDPDIDFGFLARQFKHTGGTIRNVVLSAAFMAAQDGKPIGMGHLTLALKAELQKQGRLPMKVDFGRYFALTQPEATR